MSPVNSFAARDDYFIGDDRGTVFYGNAGNDTVLGAGGDDTIYGGDGDDVLDGESGTDTIIIAASGGDDEIAVNASTVSFGSNTITYANAENLIISGGDGDDVLAQSAQPAAALVFNCGNGADELHIEAGTYTFDANTTTNLSAYVEEDASITINTTLELESLSVSGTATMSEDGAHVLVLNALTIAGTSGSYTGVLDLTNNDMIIRSGAQDPWDDTDTITDYIRCARNAEAPDYWEGMGLTSSTARDDASHLTGLAIMLNRTLSESGVAHETFDGYSVDMDCILVKFSWNGDMDCSGVVDTLDYARIDHGYLSQGEHHGYQYGDLNLDDNHQINILDYAIIDAAYLGQGDPL